MLDDGTLPESMVDILARPLSFTTDDTNDVCGYTHTLSRKKREEFTKLKKTFQLAALALW